MTVEIYDIEHLTTLPNTKPLVRFKDKWGTRWYSHPEDVEKPESWFASVTTIISVALHERMKNYLSEAPLEVQKEKLEKAVASGNAIHEAIQSDLQGKPWNAADPLLLKPMQKWNELKQAHAIKADYCELSVYSPTWGYAGTIDILGFYDGLPTILDVKTGFYNVKAGWQLAAYQNALKELTGQDAGLVGLSIKADGTKADAFEYVHLDWCLTTFLSALQTWKGLYYSRLNIQKWSYLHKPEWEIRLK